MKLNHTAAAVALTVGTLTACGANETSSEGSLTTTAIERAGDKKESLSVQALMGNAAHAQAQANETVSTDAASASCVEGRMLFHCATINSKEIKLCDHGETLEYSFGETNKTPELALSVPREEATTSQWQGIGRWISYSVIIPNADTRYAVFTSVDRLSDEHEFEAGVIATVRGEQVAQVLCREPIIHNLDGVDLRDESGATRAPTGEPRESYEQCLNASGGDTWDMQNCIEGEWDYQYSRLTNTYQELKKMLPERQSFQLSGEQKKWLSDLWSDEKCKWDAATEGQAQRIAANDCALRKVVRRADDLERRMDDIGTR